VVVPLTAMAAVIFPYGPIRESYRAHIDSSVGNHAVTIDAHVVAGMALLAGLQGLLVCLLGLRVRVDVERGCQLSLLRVRA
jgi:hypothetical protein